MNSMHATNKPFNIDKRLVYEAYKAVKSNRGAAGVDEQSIEQFESRSHKYLVQPFRLFARSAGSSPMLKCLLPHSSLLDD